ncbi:hypothetical protein QBC34DRAFT_398917 [Podospora aff. communis PSN243]|uniref:DUF1993 domain-containing protein n=1 Tax=Podospora aff. communis PSN243 TaxID=3040156 RepID=A0AAV9GX64_9PEZI|nr:hypothetical protein QBC34DRAFT_398917 [Podospora aff. communis PSN243]
MAPVTLYDTSIPVFINACQALKAILQKAKDHGSEDFTSARLIDDMLPLSFQVQTVSNTIKKAIERMIPQKGPYPVWEDNESTLDELIARVDKTLALAQTISAEDLAGKDSEVVELKLGPRGTAKAEVKGYLFGYTLPNVYFHTTTAYSILRMKGVPVGKMDYLTSFLQPNLLEGPKPE